ncbi:polyprenyl synthetase family protein [Hydrogenivirga sp. 128-5-R1-1]|uniref:polyprenyl synthetase family protein n=1 Tax=Hydrogenivirga sp. 128-5-R1-1 TaxID=392423 RepID=UPI00015F365E|nr:polyprenyl synthetase family protein [Hydrogenivirga sp. 128-5-R1-1]EDP76287.1 geranylgeranyl pyrophosphate synthase [Hydrogenivirga sp. 128-5-R1-1]
MDRLSLWKDRIEDRLRELLVPQQPQELFEAMAYYLFQPGKRVRPLLTVAVASSLGGDEEDAITVGCAIEMIHNYSLIHDDLPAMDNDDFRRGLPSCHRKFGEAMAVLAGDALLTYAFELMSKEGVFRTLSPEEVVKLINTIAVKSGIGGMVGGQALDIGGEENLEEVNLKKTAALFEACFISGGIVSHRGDLFKELEEVGREFGLLFQLVDDILDRDGFYDLLGEERSMLKAEELYRSLTHRAGVLFEERSQEIKNLIDMVYNRVT